MDLKAIGMGQLDKLQQEAKEKWGNTAAFQEFEKRKDGLEALAGGQLMEQFAKFGGMKNLAPEDPKVQMMVKGVQDLISERFFQCPNEMLKKLGDMYVSDQRFQKNIDNAGGAGTAAFVKKAIDAYCKK